MIVFSLFSPDDTVRDEHFSFDDDIQRHNFLVGNENAMIDHLVQHFAPPNGMVLDLTGWQGILC